MDTMFLSQCVRDVFRRKREIQNCLCTRDIIEGLIENFNVTKKDLDPFFLDIEKELKGCMQEAGWVKLSIGTYRQVMHNIFNVRLIHYKDQNGSWKTRRELNVEQRKSRTRMIKKAVDMVIEFYQPSSLNEDQACGIIEMEQLYNNLLLSGLLNRFGVNEFFFAVKEIHNFLKSEGFIEEGLS